MRWHADKKQECPAIRASEADGWEISSHVTAICCLFWKFRPLEVAGEPVGDGRERSFAPAIV